MWRSATRVVLAMLAASVARAQMPSGAGAPDSLDGAAGFSRVTNPVGVLFHDQRLIFSSPRRITAKDAKWLAPLAGALTFLVATDRKNMQERIHPDAAWEERSAKVSDAGVAALASIPLLLYWHGWHSGDDYARDTGLLGVRATLDTVLAAEALRLATRRDRPTEGGGAGDFFHGGVASSSFPSMHASAAWALASVVAERYPGWLTQAGAYGLAAAVSMSRVTSRDHFPSDVLVGSALGFLVGRLVAHAGDPAPVRRAALPKSRPAGGAASAASTGSSYVPLDSWVYTALDRLAALGLIPSQTSGLRPWTRAECRRQLREADEKESAGPAGTSVILAELHRELDRGAAASAVVLESVYVRSGVIAGPVLNDSMHFGETWNNDSGRPFGRGWNSDVGFTARAQSGRFFGEVQAEYQRAPGEDAYPAAVRQTVAQLDGIPVGDEGTGQPATSRFRTMEAYLGISLGDVEISAGKQAMWWGPTYDSPLSFGNNAEPTKNLKVSTQHPFHLPGILGRLGEIRGEFVIGKLGGQQYTRRPWFNAQKLSFKLTPNLELGFTRWSIFWGVGHPITVGSLLRNFVSVTSPNGAAGVGRNDPGDRKGGFDFRYRLPGLRNWLTLYSDFYSDDDPSPLAAPRRAALNPGLYLTRVPGIPRLDFRVEAPSTTPLGTDVGGQFIYYNNQYRSGNTNYGDLLGNSVGRDGRALEGWVAYHLSARDKIELGYRQLKVSPAFLPGGATQSDATIKTSLTLADGWYVSAMFQYERFWIPVLGGPQRNISGWLQLTWEPNWQILP